MTVAELNALRQRDPATAAAIDGLCAQLRAAGAEVARLQIELRRKGTPA